jgi:hypothetical protein
VTGRKKHYCDGDCSAQFDWQVRWTELQFNKHGVVACALGMGVGALLVEPVEAAGDVTTTQVVRQFATCELQFIMQLVTVELRASRIFTATAQMNAMSAYPLRGSNLHERSAREAS